jgi:haloalkane dehalogenase
MERDMTGKCYVDGPFGQVHVEIVGDGLPIVLHHQSPVASCQFRRGAAALSKLGLSAVLVDTPGFGMSDTPDRPPTIEELSQVTKAVIDKLGLAPAVVLGHHTGSMIATEAALRYPNLIRAVVLNTPLPHTPDEIEIWKRDCLGFEKNWRLRADGGHMQEIWDMMTGYAPGWSDVEAMHWTVTAILQAGETFWYGHNASFRYDHEAALRRLEVSGKPALILTNAGDICAPYARRAHELFSRFAFCELGGGTYDFANERPDDWAGSIAKFVHELDQDTMAP